MKTIFLSVFSFLSFALFAQTQITYDYFENDMSICTAILLIQNNESIFKLNDLRTSGLDEKHSTDDVFHFAQNDEISKVIYSTEKSSIVRIPLYGNEIIYQVGLDVDGAYKFTGKHKKIGDFDCEQLIHKAYGKEYDIWFTTEVPLNFGPIKLNNNPGLLVEVTDVTINRKYILNKIENKVDIVLFNKLKDYMLSKKYLMKEEYDKKVTEILTNKKRAKIAKMNENGATITFPTHEKSSTAFLIDIPEGLIPALNKISQ
ncbi:GLPGLI family protein [Flavobacterium sp.]|uniref:GLPGLI family protein n=1 Tax=Flavobacterium sp. TaxID=239 RepID=UPI003D0E71D1